MNVSFRPYRPLPSKAGLGMYLVALSLTACSTAPVPPAADQPMSQAPQTPSPPSVAQPSPVPAPAPAIAAPVEPTAAPSEQNAKVAFANDMASRGLDPREVLGILQNARFSETVAKLVLPPTSVSVRSWPRYRSRFVEPRRIKEGVQFWQNHAAMLAKTQAQYGVPASVIVAIIGVETFYGRVTGNFRIIDALSTLAFDYPAQAKSDRSAFFREQLALFLVLCKEKGWDPLAVKGSYAGAIGLPQFMPGSIRDFAVDGDGDGHIDLAANPDDAIASVANFMVKHGWQQDQPVFLPVSLPADPSALVDGGLKPTLDWPTLRATGAHAHAGPGPRNGTAWQSWPLAVIDLFDGATGTTEYRVAAPNFFAITQYNHSYFYATSVSDLAATLEQKMAQAK